MKKLFIIAFLFVFGITNAQNYLHVNITEIQDWMTYTYCTSQYDGLIVEKESGCDEWQWQVQIINGETYTYTTEEILLLPLENSYYHVRYASGWCSINWREFDVRSESFQAIEPFTQDYIWKRTGESIMLSAGGYGYQCQWSTGSTNSSITVTEPGTYWVRIYNDCGELSDTVRVQDNTEITLATCDLESNHNMVTWPTTPAQAEYVGQVEIKRDGVAIDNGMVDYSTGTFIDEIGSDAASRTYTITAIGTDGVPCPIMSYPKETIHMAYLTGINNTIELNWNAPTGYDLMGYNICEWHPGSKDGDLTVIDYVGSGVTSYTCSESMFDQGNVVVQGVESGKKGRTESRLLSNRSWETVGIGEHQGKTFKLYPNPSNGTFTVEGAKTLTITNVMGQSIATRYDENGTHSISLPRGIYIVKSGDGTVKKVVVK